MTGTALPPTLRFLLAARRAELHALESLAGTCELVTRIGSLVHALQKERGYSNMYLCRPGPGMVQTLAGLRDEAAGVEKSVRAFLGGIEPESAGMAGRARLLNCIAQALYRLDELPDLRWRVREARLAPAEARIRFTRLISILLAVVFEAADSALDADVTRTLVALLNFMQGKELSGQERAHGVGGYVAGFFSDPQKARMLALVDSQRRSFETFSQFAPEAALQAWERLQAACGPVQRMRDMAQATAESQPLDPGLAELWFQLYTERIDAMRDIERMLAEGLEQQCRRRIAETQEELDNHRLLLSRLAEQASGESGAMLFSVQGRILDMPPRDGVGSDMARSLLDVLREQTLRIQHSDEALAQARSALEERRRVERAKWLLVSRLRLSEQAAHDRMQRAAMDGGLALGDVARQVLAQFGEAAD
ncbi:nitrate- and nitrite sensing domain-containing protein [Bordetella sp. 2513F-2]